MQLYLTRTVHGFSAATDESMADMRKIKLGKIVRCEVTQPRNVHHHRKFFAMLQTVWAATGDWPSVDDLLIELKIRLGITTDVIVRSTGEVVKVLGSINFASMDQAAFDLFYDSALRELCVIAGGIDVDVLRDEILTQLAAA